MGTIERVAARLGTIGKVRAEPIVREPTPVLDATPIDAPQADASPDVNGAAPIARSGPTIASLRIGGGFCELDIDALTSAGFATQKNVNVGIGADLPRIKRPLLMTIKKSVALGRSTLPHNVILILITSAVPSEGKTFVSINLALNIAAELDRTVLLIDADVAKNDVATVLGMSYKNRLTDILDRANVHVEDTTLQTNVDSLSFLPPARMLPNVDELFAASDHVAYGCGYGYRYGSQGS